MDGRQSYSPGKAGCNQGPHPRTGSLADLIRATDSGMRHCCVMIHLNADGERRRNETWQIAGNGVRPPAAGYFLTAITERPRRRALLCVRDAYEMDAVPSPDNGRGGGHSD